MNKTKKHFYLSAVKQFSPRFLALLAAILSFSCLTPPPSGDEAVFLFIEQSERVVHANTENHVELSFNLVDTGGVLKKELRRLLYKGKSAEAYLRETSSAWKKEYAAAKNVSGDSADWFYEEAHSVARAASFAVVKRNAAEFRGGAHPVWREDSFVFDASAPARRLLLDDLFTGDGLGTLSSLIDRELRRFSAAKTGKTLPAGTPLSFGIYFEDAVVPPEDFYPADNGLTFQWDAAEIAAYSEGAIEISLRWSELTELLTPRGKALAAAFQSSGR